MLLGGLWHGAQWTFVAWGLYHGLLLGLERWLGKRSVYSGMPRPVRMVLTFVLVLISWVLFRSPTIADAGHYLATMVGHTPATSALYPSSTGDDGRMLAAMLLAAKLYTPTHFAIMTFCAVLVIQPVQTFEWATRLSWPKVLVLVPLFLLAIGEMFTQAFNPFLYFRF